MSLEPTLWDARPAPYRAGNVTSQEAAEKITPLGAGIRWLVLDFIKQSGGAFNEQIATALGMKIQTISARCNELQHMGLVAHKGRFGRTTSGCRAKIWEVDQ